jgi:hypothetical protein
MNKIQVLIDNEFITLNEVLEYAYNHNALEELNNNHQDEIDYDYPDYHQDELDRMKIEEFEDSYYDQMISKYNLDEPTIDTTYVLASTNYLMEETMVFPSNEEGEIVSYSDLANLALRYGHEYWEDAFAAVVLLNTDEYKYIHVKTIDGGNNIHNLFKKVKVSDNVVI